MQSILTSIFPSILGAIALLTRIPVPNHECNMNKVIWAYPLVGLIVGLISSGVAILFSCLGITIPLMTLAIITVLTNAMITGALHFDGLADCADGFWGSMDKKRRLEIMKDSRIGAYGTIAIIIAISLYISIYTQLLQDIEKFTISVIVASISSRTTMAMLQISTPYAKNTGLLSSIGNSTISLGIVALMLSFALNYFIIGLIASIYILFIMTITAIILRTIFIRKISGITGDCLGATQMIVEIILLITLYNLSYNSQFVNILESFK